ncbi:hypothetical protein V1517DRAFT_370114 [Lipomyces orientalis]|uniref:Uncharacterized protein n=1 Tax=Lipomyces orientalis TaxID=1233043 RepID=A0ACC3TE20_9ASCO
MATDRSLGRDVHFYDSSSPDKVLGGLMLTPSITERVFLFALGILICIDTPLRPTDEPLQPGKYDIKSNSPQGRIFITNEWCVTRILSQSVSSRDEVFRQRVRERDRKCVITGVANPDRHIAWNDWSSYHAAHIFPLSGEEWFIRNNYFRWITNREGTHDTGINSCQNGLLMLSHIHENNENCVRDELLRWHFRQAVLANMRGAGEPVFETDFPPGSDMVGEIRNGPDAIKRMEAQLFARLGGLSLV